MPILTNCRRSEKRTTVWLYNFGSVVISPVLVIRIFFSLILSRHYNTAGVNNGFRNR